MHLSLLWMYVDSGKYEGDEFSSLGVFGAQTIIIPRDTIVTVYFLIST